MAEAKEEAKVMAEEAPAAVVAGEEEKSEAAAETAGVAGAAEVAAEDAAAAVEEESPFYKDQLKPQLIITRFRPGRQNRQNSRYGRLMGRLGGSVDRARRMLRAYDEIQIHGVETGIASACALVEILKREKVAVIKSVQTNVNLMPQRYFDIKTFFSESYMSIDFVLSRGEYAEYITDMKQRRLVAIFEKFDPERTGYLSKATVEGLDMADTFYATEERKANGAAFLKSIPGDNVSMPDFIRYASALIDDTLRSYVFGTRAAEKYGIPPPPPRRNNNRDNNK